MHDFAASLMMLIVLALAPWTAHFIADRTVTRFGSNGDGEARVAQRQRLD